MTHRLFHVPSRWLPTSSQNEPGRQGTLGVHPAALGRTLSANWPVVAAFALPFLLYLQTLAPTIYNLDSSELTTAAATGGLVRATGYPLYLVLGKLWSLLPFGDVGYRLNLFSAFSGALTLALLALILRRLRVGPWATLGALGLLACSATFWALSLIAEVYTLHTVLMAALLLLLLRWADHPTPRRLALVGLALGLGLAHHAATLLLIPGCIWYVLTVAPRRALAPRALLFGLGALLAGLGLYLYLPLRYAARPAFNYAGWYDATGTFQPLDLGTVSGLWWLVSARAFATQMFAYSGVALWQQAQQFGAELWGAFLGLGIGPGLLGMAVLLRRNWRAGGLLVLTFLCNAAFYIDYRAGDKATMFLPVYVVWALWLGIGYHWLLTWVGEAGDAFLQRWGTSLLRAAMIGVVLFAVAWNWRLVDLSDDWSTRTHGDALLAEMEPNALVFGWWDTVPVIEYLQLVDGRRPDVQAINRFLIANDAMTQLIEREMARRPIYTDSLSTSLLRTFRAEPVGDLYRLRPME